MVSIDDVDLGVCRRQAIGEVFTDKPTDAEDAAAVLQGSIALRPHPAWQFAGPTPDWSADPFGQANWQAQLHMLRFLEPLRRQASKGDSGAKDVWLRIARDWAEKYGTAPGKELSRFAWMDMVDGMRALCLALGLPLAQDDPEWLLQTLKCHGDWLFDERNIGHSNHSLVQHQALFVLGALFRCPEWKDRAIGRLREQFQDAYDDQGINDEGAIAYHLMNLKWWSAAWARLEAEGSTVPAEAERRLDLARLALVHATRPDGRAEAIGDSEPKPLLRVLETPEATYMRTKGADGTPPSDRVAVFNRGYVFGRSGWGEFARAFQDETFYSLSFGPANRVHGHPDGASLTWHQERQQWLVDAGKYMYKPSDPIRRYLLSRHAHNVPTIRGKTYDNKAVVRLVSSRQTPDLDEFVFEDEGYRGNLITRRFVYLKAIDAAIIVDIATGQERIELDQWWHFAPEVRVQQERHGYTAQKNGRTFKLQWIGTVPDSQIHKGATDPHLGWYSPQWGEALPATTVQATREGRSVRIVTFIGAGVGETPQIIRTGGAPGTVVLVAKRGRTTVTVTLKNKGATDVHQGDQLARVTSSQQEESPLVKLGNFMETIASPRSWPEKCNLTENGIASLKEWVRSRNGAAEARAQACGALIGRQVGLAPQSPDQGLLAAIVDLAGPDLLARAGVSASDLAVGRHPLLTWSQGQTYASTTYPAATIQSFADALEDSSDAPRIAVTDLGGLSLAAYFRPKDSRVLVARFHGALDRAKITLPVFSGIGLDEAADYAYINFSDPTLDLSPRVRLSWYLGTPQTDATERIARAIEQVMEARGYEHCVLTGSSGGGFTALQTGLHMRHPAVALAFNPQTDVREYFAATQNALLEAWGLKAFPDGMTPRLSLPERIKGYDGPLKILYLQNEGDVFHLKRHHGPFEFALKDSGFPESQYRCIRRDDGPGHVSLPRHDLSEFTATAIAWAQQ